MGWFGFGDAEKSSGDTGKVSDVKVSVKVDKGGDVRHVLVNESRGNPHQNHGHYYDKGKSGWGKSTKGRG